MSEPRLAPGGPGLEPRWVSSKKAGVGTAVSSGSPLWFTLGHGILNELYYPTIDQANTRDVGFLVVNNDSFSEVKRDCEHRVDPLAQGVPGFKVVNTCENGGYRLSAEIITDPRRPVLLMRIRFEVLKKPRSGYRLYVLIAPHVANQGAENEAWVEQFKGTEMLCAGRDSTAFAVGCSTGWASRSCGYVGVNDGWTQLQKNKRLVQVYDRVSKGNVALTGEIRVAQPSGDFLLAIGFGAVFAEATHNARAGLLEGFESTLKEFSAEWDEFHRGSVPLQGPHRHGFDLYRASTTVVRVHESKQFHGGVIASLSNPWGQTKGDKQRGGYHVVWPRDQFHAAMGMLAAGYVESARQTLFYLIITQEADGSWPQNMWVDGAAFRRAHQSDQTGAFLILAHRLWREDELDDVPFWPALKNAAEALMREGPVTDQDRWEENRGYTPYTLALIIAGLVGTAEIAEKRGDQDLADRCRTKADTWNACLDFWLYVRGTPLAQKIGVDGYYVRLAPPGAKSTHDLERMKVALRNYAPAQEGEFAAAEVVSPDALALVRYGLRAADDLRIENTIKVIDAVLKTETRAGPAWRRFNHDAYGESADGRPFDGKTGIGRSWPLLTGERAHYELARGNRRQAEQLLETMANQASVGGLFPEQIWDANDIPAMDLFNGGPTGSAMPLVWAHAEFVTLVRSLKDGYVFDCPAGVRERYVISAQAEV